MSTVDKVICGRKNFGIENVTRNSFLCSKHFVGGNWPTYRNLSTQILFQLVWPNLSESFARAESCPGKITEYTPTSSDAPFILKVWRAYWPLKSNFLKKLIISVNAGIYPITKEIEKMSKSTKEYNKMLTIWPPLSAHFASNLYTVSMAKYASRGRKEKSLPNFRLSWQK